MLIVSSLIRRWWGGWFSPTHWVKLVAVFLISFSQVCVLFSNIYLALCIGAITLLSFLNPFHGEGMRMGHGETPLAECILIMGGSYSFYTLLMSVIYFYVSNNLWIFTISIYGFAVAFSYWFWWWFFDKLLTENGQYKKFGEYPKGNWFIDGPGACGELSLGAIIFIIPHVAKLMGV